MGDKKLLQKQKQTKSYRVDGVYCWHLLSHWVLFELEELFFHLKILPFVNKTTNYLMQVSDCMFAYTWNLSYYYWTLYWISVLVTIALSVWVCVMCSGQQCYTVSGGPAKDSLNPNRVFFLCLALFQGPSSFLLTIQIHKTEW